MMRKDKFPEEELIPEMLLDEVVSVKFSRSSMDRRDSYSFYLREKGEAFLLDGRFMDEEEQAIEVEGRKVSSDVMDVCRKMLEGLPVLQENPGAKAEVLDGEEVRLEVAGQDGRTVPLEILPDQQESFREFFTKILAE